MRCVCSVNNNSICEHSDKCKFVIFFSFAHNLASMCGCAYVCACYLWHNADFTYFSFCTHNTQLLIIFYSVVFPFFFTSLCAIPGKFLWLECAFQSIPLFIFIKCRKNANVWVSTWIYMSRVDNGMWRDPKYVTHTHQTGLYCICMYAFHSQSEARC